MNQLLVLLLFMLSLLFATIALYKAADEPLHLKIEVEVQYGK